MNAGNSKSPEVKKNEISKFKGMPYLCMCVTIMCVCKQIFTENVQTFLVFLFVCLCLLHKHVNGNGTAIVTEAYNFQSVLPTRFNILWQGFVPL